MKKSLSLLIVLISLFLFNSSVLALSVPADGKWHEYKSSDINSTSPINNCRVKSGAVTAVWDSDKNVCKIKSTSTSTSNSEFVLEYYRANAAIGKPGWNELTGTLTGSSSSSRESSTKEQKSEQQVQENWEETFGSACQNKRIIGSFKLIGMGITIVKIIVPIIIILYGMWDLFNIVVSGKDDAIKENVMKFIRRLIIGGLVFFVPTIMLALFDFVGSSWKEVKDKYGTCIECMLDTSKCPTIDLTD